MGRPKGYKPSAEQIAAMQEGRRKAKEEKIAAGIPIRTSKKRSKKNVIEIRNGKPVLTVTGKEKNAFDFYTPVRDTFRLLGRHNEIDKILQKITDKVYWLNLNWVLQALSEFVVLEEA